MEYDFDNTDSSETKTTAKVVTDMVCPVCFCHIKDPTIMVEGPDSFGRQLRTYFGYCDKCRAAHVVVQFARDRRWVIHKFRQAIIRDANNEIETDPDWQLMSELPAPTDTGASPLPAPVILGPGGDFIKEITPELSQFRTNIKIMQEALGKLLNKIDGMLNGNGK